MAATINVDKNWNTERKRKLQQWMNRYGFTDANGDKLGEDGIIGPKTYEALEKLNRYQQDLKSPTWETQQLQKQLNEWGYRDANGSSLKEDGVYGPKTDAANNEFENSFLGGLTNGESRQKTVQKKEFPKFPGVAEIDLQNIMTGLQEWAGENLRPVLDPFGMNYIKGDQNKDKANSDVWIADESGIQENYGYNDLYDKLVPMLGFDLETKPIVFNYKDENGKDVEYRFQPWYGLYGMDTFSPGAESGLYQNDGDFDRDTDQKISDVLEKANNVENKAQDIAKALLQINPFISKEDIDSIFKKLDIIPDTHYEVVPDDKKLGMQIELYNGNDPLIDINSADIDGPRAWLYENKVSAGNVDKNNLYMKETLSYKDKGFLEALKEAGEKAGLDFEEEIEYNDKTKMYTISYTYDPNNVRRAGGYSGSGFGGGGGGSW